MKLQALTTNERETRRERDSLQLKLAAAEQDKLVMEVRMREMVGFQTALRGDNNNYNNNYNNNESSSLLDKVRGKLLTVANQKITDLTDSLNELQVVLFLLLLLLLFLTSLLIINLL